MSQSTAVKRYFSLTWEITKTSIISAMEFRVTFLSQILGMVINDGCFALLWFIFFKTFPSINGWQFKDSALLLALATANFGLVMVFARGASDLARTIARGELDYYFSFPVNLLWYIVVSKTEISAIGDFIFGIMIFFATGDISAIKFLVFIMFVALTAVLLLNFIITFESISFFVGNFEEASGQIFDALLGFTLYPQSIFTGALKAIMMTIIPAFFIATVPVRLMREFNLSYFLMLICFAITSFLLAITIFHAGLKRYESGNSFNVKM